MGCVEPKSVLSDRHCAGGPAWGRRGLAGKLKIDPVLNSLHFAAVATRFTPGTLAFDAGRGRLYHAMRPSMLYRPGPEKIEPNEDQRV